VPELYSGAPQLSARHAVRDRLATDLAPTRLLPRRASRAAESLSIRRERALLKRTTFRRASTKETLRNSGRRRTPRQSQPRPDHRSGRREQPKVRLRTRPGTSTNQHVGAVATA